VAVKPTVIVKNDVDTSHFLGGGLTAPNITGESVVPSSGEHSYEDK